MIAALALYKCMRACMYTYVCGYVCVCLYTDVYTREIFTFMHTHTEQAHGAGTCDGGNRLFYVGTADRVS